MNFVQLNRTFIDFRDRETDEAAIERSTRARYSSGEISWAELIKTPCVVVLGEAGIGKTREFEEQAKGLTSQGKEAFFVDIASLATDNLPQALYLQDAERLGAWKAGSADAVFFLDSVDEARLRYFKDFERALKKIQQCLGKDQVRVRFVISCRVSDWQASTDLRIVKSFIERASLQSSSDPQREDQESGEEIPQVRVVQMAPLNLDQVTDLIKEMGVQDHESFLKEVRDNDAEAFVGRPRDVEWMAEYWQTKHQLLDRPYLIQRYKETHRK